MIDCHCHLLPGIDDGAENMAQALDLARAAVANGITHSIVTPHIHPGRYENDRQSIEQVFSAFQQALQNEDIPLLIGFAGEVRLSAEILAMTSLQQIPFYGRWNEKQVLLLEFPHSHIPPGSDKLVKWLLDKNILPMIAHPERNKDVMRDSSKLTPFIEMGCLMQLTASSVAGHFGSAAAERSRELLEKGVVTLIASDAHNLEHRPPRLDHGRDAAAQIIGEAEARKLVWDNPLLLVREQFSDDV